MSERKERSKTEFGTDGYCESSGPGFFQGWRSFPGREMGAGIQESANIDDLWITFHAVAQKKTTQRLSDLPSHRWTRPLLSS